MRLQYDAEKQESLIAEVVVVAAAVIYSLSFPHKSKIVIENAMQFPLLNFQMNVAIIIIYRLVKYKLYY